MTAHFANFLGFGLIAIAMLVVFLSPYRRWLGFMLAGMSFWGVLELIRFSLQYLFDVPVTYGYLAALSLAMVVVTLILVREDRLARKVLENRQYIEHTPVYDDE